MRTEKEITEKTEFALDMFGEDFAEKVKHQQFKDACFAGFVIVAMVAVVGLMLKVTLL